MADLFALQGDAVVQAGAGTGKTHSLVTLCLHLLAGVGRAEPLSPARLCAVTFTEKAAAELKGRLRQRVDRLAQGDPAELEPELARSFAASGKAPLPAGHWRRVRRDLGLAQIGTIHGLCAQILRRNAAPAGVDPSFGLVDEADARRLLHEACEDAALHSLDGRLGPEAEQAARRLCAEFGFRGGGKGFGSGLAEELVSLVAALGESGRDAAALAEETAGLAPAAALEEHSQACDALRAAIDRLEAAARAALLKNPAANPAARALEAIGEFRARGAAVLSSTSPGALAQRWPALRPVLALLGRKGNGAVAEASGDVKAAFEALLEADAAIRSCALARDLGLLARTASSRYRTAKARAAALDFDDLTRLARDLVVRVAAVREAEQERLGVLLIDEFQDTSRPQLELFAALARAPLVTVGDRKQSIYEFRGADVAGAQAFAARLLKAGAGAHVLRESRRSRPALVSFANLLFGETLAAAEHPFDTPFGDDDALRAHRAEGAPGACAELLDVRGPGVDAEAEVVARRIAALLAEGASERVYDAGEAPRRIRGGDIAILLRRFTNVEAFRRALLRRRIPHLILKGRGFHEAREIVDLVSLLTLAVDPDDALALATVLRSPLGPVSDNGLVLLAHAGERRRLDRRALTDRAVHAVLDPDDAAAVARLAALLGRLEREVDRLGPAALLEAVLAELDLVAAYAGGLYGEQAAANLDKLLTQARAHELHGGSVRSFLARMRELADEEAREPDAAVAEERDPHAVRMLTVHAAKGLEFPVVFVPECATRSSQPFTGNVLLEPDLGLAVKVRGADGERRWGRHGLEVKERKQQREVSQSRRLLYVAVTRARDLVVLSSRSAQKAESWRGWLDKVERRAVDAGLLRVLPDGGPQLARAAPEKALIDARPDVLASLVSGRPLAPLAEATPAAAEARLLVERICAGVPAAQPTVSVPVTQLADASACARRYQLLHELRLEERPDPEPSLPDPLGAEPGQAPASALGTLVHRLLELAPLGLAPRPSTGVGDGSAARGGRPSAGVGDGSAARGGRPSTGVGDGSAARGGRPSTGVGDGSAARGGLARRAELQRQLALEGEDPAAHEEIVDAAASFLDSPLGARMARARSEHLQRELPFVLRLVPGAGDPPGPELLVRGQLDVLLLDGESATVVDYKLSRATDPERYGRQLDAYALAAHELVQGAVPVKTGIVFLRSKGAPYAERPSPDAAALARIRSELLAAGHVLAEGRRTGSWPKVARARCEELRCGFIRRCHPEEAR